MNLNPFFDAETIAWIPVWAWILAALLIIFLITLFYWLWRRKIMAGVTGLREAAENTGITPEGYQVVATLTFAKTKMFQILSLYYRDGVLSFGNSLQNISKWLHTSKLAVGRLGPLTCLFASDDLDVTRDLVAELAIVTIADKYNEELGDQNSKDAIVDHDTFQAKRKLLEYKYPDGVKMLAYQLYDPKKTHKFLPLNRPAGRFGGVLEYMAEEEIPAKPQAGILDRLVGAITSPVGMAFTAGLIGNVLLYVFLKKV
jgi:hypothetical protein